MKTNAVKESDKRASRPGERDCENCTRVAPAASPFKLEKILVPVDFLDCSRKALLYAVPFARQFKAQMIFLHVVAPPYSAGWGLDVAAYDPAAEGNLRAKTEKRLRALIEETVPARIPTRMEFRQGPPAIEIVDAARELNAGLIIMSTHGHTGRIHAFIGSVAADVTRLAPCPVLVVREHERDFVPSELPPIEAGQRRSQTVDAPSV